MTRLQDIKQNLLIKHNLSVLDINWEYLEQGELIKLIRWERKRDKRTGKVLGIGART